MSISTAVKETFPPLWPAGLHPLEIAAIRARCVTAFSMSTSRPPLMVSFEAVLDRLTEVSINGDVWLGGSFVTEKINPQDVDFILVIDSALYDEGTPEQRDVIDGLIDGTRWTPPESCDTNVAFIDPPERSNSDDLLAFWRKRLGYSSDGLVPKGIVVLKVATRRESK